MALATLHGRRVSRSNDTGAERVIRPWSSDTRRNQSAGLRRHFPTYDSSHPPRRPLSLGVFSTRHMRHHLSGALSRSSPLVRELTERLAGAIGRGSAHQEVRWMRDALQEQHEARDEMLSRMLARRVAGEPLQYILGTSAFVRSHFLPSFLCCVFCFIFPGPF